MSDKDLPLIPSHNLDRERNLAISSIHIENTSECLNCHFKAWSTADKAVLHKFSQVKGTKMDIKEILDHVNRSVWSTKKLKKNKIEELLEIGKHRDYYIDEVLEKCKLWGGPFLCIYDIEAVISGKSSDDQRKILHHETTFQKSTQLNEALISKELYLIKKRMSQWWFTTYEFTTHERSWELN